MPFIETKPEKYTVLNVSPPHRSHWNQSQWRLSGQSSSHSYHWWSSPWHSYPTHEEHLVGVVTENTYLYQTKYWMIYFLIYYFLIIIIISSCFMSWSTFFASGNSWYTLHILSTKESFQAYISGVQQWSCPVTPCAGRNKLLLWSMITECWSR